MYVLPNLVYYASPLALQNLVEDYINETKQYPTTVLISHAPNNSEPTYAIKNKEWVAYFLAKMYYYCYTITLMQEPNFYMAYPKIPKPPYKEVALEITIGEKRYSLYCGTTGKENTPIDSIAQAMQPLTEKPYTSTYELTKAVLTQLDTLNKDKFEKALYINPYTREGEIAHALFDTQRTFMSCDTANPENNTMLNKKFEGVEDNQ